MAKVMVKVAAGRRLRHPQTLQVLPHVANEEDQPLEVDDTDPHWFRAIRDGDLVVIDPAKEAAPAEAVPAEHQVEAVAEEAPVPQADAEATTEHPAEGE